MIDQNIPSLFTPSNTDPEVLEAILVQRNEMLNDAIERVKESASTGNKHHLLFVGPRGTGKTHLMTLLVHRLNQNTKLKKQLRIAWLEEDKTSTTLLDFLKRIYLALNKRYKKEFDLDSLSTIYDLKVDEAKNYIAKLLLEKLKKHTLLVVVENLDALFEALKKSGQQELRAFIQENPVLSIVATAQKLTDDISKRKSTFFGFFQTEQLKTLSIEDAAELLEKIAQLNKQDDVVKFLRSATGRSRVRALFHLSGGNHRIYIALSRFITHDSINKLVDLFSKMIDEMTPYYQERIRWLAPQQRQIIEYLCTCERPAAVKTIARNLFVSNQSISSQLKDLRDKGYVESAQRGRESLYEIAEPLMRLCVEVKENQSAEPLRMLVDFLRVWYNGEELSNRLKGCGAKGIEHRYLKFAIAKNELNGNLRAQLIVDGFRHELDKAQDERWNNRIDNYANKSEELALAFGVWTEGKVEQAINLLNEITDEKSNYDNQIKVSAWDLMAEIYYKEKSFMRAIKAFDTILALPNIEVKYIARSLFNRAIANGKNNDVEKEIADYSVLIDLADAPVELVSKALVLRGLLHGENNEFEQELADYRVLINLKGAPLELVAKTLLLRGIIYGENNEYKKAINDFSALIILDGASIEHVAEALISRGIIYGENGSIIQEIADYNAVIGLKNAPVEQVAIAFLKRGANYFLNEKYEASLKDYSALIKLVDVPVKQVASALFLRGLTYSSLNDEENYKNDNISLIHLDSAPLYLRMNAYFNLADIFVNSGRWNEAITMLEEVLLIRNEVDDVDLENTLYFIDSFFESTLNSKVREERVISLVKIYNDNNAIAQLGDSLIKHLGIIYLSDEKLPSSDNLESWASAWEKALNDVDEFRLPQRIFRTGIDFLKEKGKDRGILLDLNQEERQILEQALGLDDEI